MMKPNKLLDEHLGFFNKEKSIFNSINNLKLRSIFPQKKINFPSTKHLASNYSYY